MTEKQDPRTLAAPSKPAPQAPPPPADLDEYIFRQEGVWRISER